MADDFTVTGTTVDGSGTPLSGVELRAFDVDLLFDDPLGTATTDAEGRFEIRFSEADYGGSIEGGPEVYLVVTGPGSRSRRVPVDLTERAADVELVIPSEEDHTMTHDPDRPNGGGEAPIGGDGHSSGGMMDARSRMPGHGKIEHRGVANVPRDPHHPGQGRFGRLFPYLEPADHDVAFLEALGLPGGVLDEGVEPDEEAETVPAGFVFLGQFIDHDITLDPLSSLDRQNDPDALRNFRTPRLDLDSVYGAGPEASPHLYQSAMSTEPHSGDDAKFLLGLNAAGEPDDLPRNRDGTALVGDPRNDENHLLSQLQHVFLKFHNAVVDHLRAAGYEEDVFERAQTLVRWHYQWIVLHEFLPTICDEDVVEETLVERSYYAVERGDTPYIPLEFSGAVYRYGHSQARLEYRINDAFGSGKLFDREDPMESLGMGFQAVPPEKVVDWRNLFDIDSDPQPARAIDTKLSPDLLDLPFVSADRSARDRSLASRNLVRGRRLGLPSGQAIARAMDEEVFANEDIEFDEAIDEHGQPDETEAPLWYYVLGEARAATGGEFLGPVGSRIVSEVLVGLIDSDPSSFRVVQPGWEPTLPAPHAGHGDFSIADLVSFALGY